ncbi:GNAT family N-acetyltransferase [Sporosarcina beigongshangi]|uniref:GNAT family N-acetyltransferase n=1 Tax=Sporosarcina beigongshangi TaxID=2782538 RepID=UPI00193A5B83|nr:GNAT family N-acetyltransferase [Sporosarcina beigongshangi]
MEIKFATTSDAAIIHDLMMQAFIVYKNETPPSSALEETIQSIATALEDDEQVLIGYMANQPVAMVRFQVQEDCIYFYRLSVIPEKQGQGIAKEILKALEVYALEQDKSLIQCKVRMSVPKNIALYQSIGYEICDEEVVYKPDGVTVKVVSMKKRFH